MIHSTPPYANRKNRETMTPPSSETASGRRVIGLLLSLASIALALPALYFSLQNIAFLILSLLILIFGVRMFAIWLSARPQAQPTSGWQPPVSQYRNATGNSGTPQPSQISARPTPLTASQLEYSRFDTFVPGNPYETTLAYKLPGGMPPLAEQPYIPIEQDEFFALDQPLTNERCFLLPKEGDPLVECQDRYALATSNGYRCYAVADGVAGSFVPGPWARVVAKSFVERTAIFGGKDEFQRWLLDCSWQWQTWIQQRWVTTINAIRQQNGDGARDWSQEIGQGAQTTLIACILNPPQQTGNYAFTPVTVFAIGDSICFHFSPDQQKGWSLQNVFPYGQSEDFNAHPVTLMTAVQPELADRAWTRHKATTFSVRSGDLIVLATDTLAKWILTQIEQQTNRWQSLLSLITFDDFEHFIRSEFHRNQVEDDDVTMLVIPI
jgi:hypothetical protein